MKKNTLNELARTGFSGYPVASVSYYGPDNTFATKVAVGIVLSDHQESDDIEMRKWVCGDMDIRFNENINNEILRFILSRNVKSVGIADRIIGCPHESGLDYPEGDSCPLCPFWKNRDRFTHEIIDE